MARVEGNQARLGSTRVMTCRDSAQGLPAAERLQRIDIIRKEMPRIPLCADHLRSDGCHGAALVT
jgi:hypothetical protein